jgi:hypothetical protein
MAFRKLRRCGAELAKNRRKHTNQSVQKYTKNILDRQCLAGGYALVCETTGCLFRSSSYQAWRREGKEDALPKCLPAPAVSVVIQFFTQNDVTNSQYLSRGQTTITLNICVTNALDLRPRQTSVQAARNAM